MKSFKGTPDTWHRKFYVLNVAQKLINTTLLRLTRIKKKLEKLFPINYFVQNEL